MLENGLYVVLPLAACGLAVRWNSRRDTLHVLSFLCISAHAAYLLHIGGDHFEYRPLDFYWPLLYVAGVDGVLGLAAWTRRIARSRVLEWASLAFLVGLWAFYASVLQVRWIGLDQHVRNNPRDKVEPASHANYAPSRALPASWLAAHSDSAHYCWLHGIAAPHYVLRALWTRLEQDFGPYERVYGKSRIPESLVISRASVGIVPFYLGEVTVIDRHGLTDRHVARLQLEKPNDERFLAHDRFVDVAYLGQRGVNIDIGKPQDVAVSRAGEVLLRGATRGRPVDALRRPRPGVGLRDVRGTRRLDACGGRRARYVRRGLPRRLGGRGDALHGQPVSAQPRNLRPWNTRVPIEWKPRRFSDESMIHTGLSPNGKRATGRARSPEFRPPPGCLLEFRFGGRRKGTGVALYEGERKLREWTPPQRGPPEAGGVRPLAVRAPHAAARDLRRLHSPARPRPRRRLRAGGTAICVRRMIGRQGASALSTQRDQDLDDARA